MASMIGDIASNWRAIQGEDKWKGLLDPLDIDLRRSLLVYGSLAQATEDGFEKDQTAKHFGDCRYKEAPFFQRVYLENGNPYKYQVTKYIYATSSVIPLWPVPIGKDSNWIGYVAVATDDGKKVLGRRDVVVVWRGTLTQDEINDDFAAVLVPPLELLPGVLGLVHRGFLSVYITANDESPYDKTSARDQVLGEVRKLVDQYKDEDMSITVTGFSLGGALTTLNSIDIVGNGYNRPSDNPSKAIPVTAVGFACPRVGDLIFTKQYNNMENLSFIKVRNQKDIVPCLPVPLPLFPYFDCGVELLLDTRLSPYLKDSQEALLSYTHYLEVYLHGVAGTHGIDGEFKLEIDRPLALVNKGGDALVDDLKIPVGWWAESKGMVQWKDGTWHLKNEVETTAESST